MACQSQCTYNRKLAIPRFAVFQWIRTEIRQDNNFVGDIAQLPPVKLKLSPALSKDILELQFNCEVDNLTLDDVVRQDALSGILFNATKIRELLLAEKFEGFEFILDGFKDVFKINEGGEFF